MPAAISKKKKGKNDPDSDDELYGSLNEVRFKDEEDGVVPVRKKKPAANAAKKVTPKKTVGMADGSLDGSRRMMSSSRSSTSSRKPIAEVHLNKMAKALAVKSATDKTAETLEQSLLTMSQLDPTLLDDLKQFAARNVPPQELAKMVKEASKDSFIIKSSEGVFHNIDSKTMQQFLDQRHQKLDESWTQQSLSFLDPKTMADLKQHLKLKGTFFTNKETLLKNKPKAAYIVESDPGKYHCLDPKTLIAFLASRTSVERNLEQTPNRRMSASDVTFQARRSNTNTASASPPHASDALPNARPKPRMAASDRTFEVRRQVTTKIANEIPRLGAIRENAPLRSSRRRRTKDDELLLPNTTRISDYMAATNDYDLPDLVDMQPKKNPVQHSNEVEC